MPAAAPARRRRTEPSIAGQCSEGLCRATITLGRVRSPDAALTGAPRARPLAALLADVTPGALLLAAALPIVFLHLRYQPDVVAGRATIKLSDLAILVVAVAAAWTGLRRGWAPLQPGRWVWIAGIAFLVWLLAAVFYPLASSRAYAWKTHLVTAGEFGEYMLLAPAVPLLLRRRADACLALGTLVAWSVIATVVGLVQWAGWTGLAGWGQGNRQPSFLGTHDFAALSGMTLGVGIVALLWRVDDRQLRLGAWVAAVSGVVGFVLGGASAGVVGLVPAVVVAVAIAARRGLVARRALAAALAATAIASLGVLVLRVGDFGQFFRFLGVQKAESSTTQNIQTYSQRTVLAYIGVRIWLHHPIVGVGWEGSSDPSVFVRELPAAHRRFPHVASISFPSAQRRYGVQVLYVQALADLGVVGFVLLVAFFAAAIVVGARSALRAPPRV